MTSQRQDDQREQPTSVSTVAGGHVEPERERRVLALEFGPGGEDRFAGFGFFVEPRFDRSTAWRRTVGEFECGFGVPFPLNLVLFPLNLVEWYIRYSITSPPAAA